jgi:prolyl-tRNA synthetase
MYISNYLLPIQQEKPQNATMSSHCLMQQAGMVKQAVSGIYSWLPFGLTILKKIEAIIREEMNNSGCIELLTPCMQPASLWEISERINDYGKELLKVSDRHGQTLLFAPSAEEMVTQVVQTHLTSHKHLPKILYQFQWKFRDEIRPKSGLLRSREFLMKDAYSYDIDDIEAEKTYWNMYKTYLKIYHRLGLNVLPSEADNGVIGGNLSHEFHVLADHGQSVIYYDPKLEETLGNFLNKEDNLDNLNLEDIKKLSKLFSKTEDKITSDEIKDNLSKKNSIEVGHIFFFGNKYSTKLNAVAHNKQGNIAPLSMGSYGIGLTRLVASIIEINHDKNGIKLPINLAPFSVCIVLLSYNDNNCCNLAKEYYTQLRNLNIDVLFDDSQVTAKMKMQNNDLIGIPFQILLGNQLMQEGKIEIKNRFKSCSSVIRKEEAINYLMHQIKLLKQASC